MHNPVSGIIFDSPNTPKHSYTVLDYKLNVDIRSCFITPFPKSFTGSVIITFKVDSVLNSITLNALNASLTIGSVSLAGVSFTHVNNILTVNLNRQYNLGEIAQVKIDYVHNNVTDQSFYVNSGMVFTD